MAYKDRTVLAVVPARKGSKGIPHKNLQRLGGVSLIGWAGRVLEQLPWIDARILSTDSPMYAREGRRYGLEAPYLREAALSTDDAPVLEAVKQVLIAEEARREKTFDVVLILEPTSPSRTAADVARTVDALLDSGAKSAFTVSPIPRHYHPRKSLAITGSRMHLYLGEAAAVARRQELHDLYWRNGVCYALTRASVVDGEGVLTSHTVPVVIDRPVVNVDTPRDLALASLLLALHDE